MSDITWTGLISGKLQEVEAFLESKFGKGTEYNWQTHIGLKGEETIDPPAIMVVYNRMDRDPKTGLHGWFMYIDVVLVDYGDDALPLRVIQRMEFILDELQTNYLKPEEYIMEVPSGFMPDEGTGYINWLRSQIAVRVLDC